MAPGTTDNNAPGRDRNGLRILPKEDCLLRLRSHPVHLGRLGFVADDQPVILPVNYRLYRDEIVFATDPGAKLDAVRRGDRVAFEVDAVDPAWREGWSVLIQGTARDVTNDEERRDIDRLGMGSWAVAGTRYIVITPDRITGRQID